MAMDRIEAPVSRYIAAGIAVSVAAVITGVTFAGWLHHGAEIFLSHATSGLAWCF